MKLALSGLLNPREEVISLFRSSTFASYCCHTSNYKLIGLKMQIKFFKKKKGSPISIPRFAEKSKQSGETRKHHLISWLACFPGRLSKRPRPPCSFTCIWFVSGSLTAQGVTLPHIINCENVVGASVRARSGFPGTRVKFNSFPTINFTTTVKGLAGWWGEGNLAQVHSAAADLILKIY